MKTLIVTAHPSPEGHAHAVARAYAHAVAARSGEAKIVDLYDPAYELRNLAFGPGKSRPECECLKSLRQMIAWADEVVFVHPTWWNGMPAVLKNFLDCVLAPKFAFEYTADHRSRGLLGPRTARVFVTMDAPVWVSRWLLGDALRKTWKYVLGFCGFRVKSFDAIGEMFRDDGSRFQKFLALASSRARG